MGSSENGAIHTAPPKVIVSLSEINENIDKEIKTLKANWLGREVSHIEASSLKNIEEIASCLKDTNPLQIQTLTLFKEMAHALSSSKNPELKKISKCFQTALEVKEALQHKEFISKEVDQYLAKKESNIENLSDRIKTISEMFSQKTSRSMALAHLINKEEIPLAVFAKRGNISKEELIELAPFTKIVRLTDNFWEDEYFFNEIIEENSYVLSEDFQKVFLEKSSPNLTRLDMFNSLISEIPECPNCEEFMCNGCKNIKELPNFSPKRFFSAENCENLKNVPDLSLCTHIYLYNCRSLEKLSNIPNCQVLDINNCSSLKELSGVSNCKELVFEGCNSLLTLQDISNCLKIEFKNSKLITKLENIKNCGEIILSSPLLTKVERVLNCKSLSISDSNKLTELLEIDCENIVVSHCKALTKISSGPSNTTLKISFCEKLDDLSNVSPELVHLDCNSCKNLKIIPDLQYCETLKCFSTGITELSGFPNCTTLNASFNLELVEIKGFEDCESINVDYCAKLAKIPAFPSCRFFQANNSFLITPPQINRENLLQKNFIVDEDLIKKTPKIYLEELRKKYKNKVFFPNVYFKKGEMMSEGIDAGGLGREFFSLLFEHLFADKEDKTTFKTEEIEDTENSLDKERFPLFRDPQDSSDYQMVGNLFARCYIEDNFKVGELFGEHFFEVLRNIDKGKVESFLVLTKADPCISKLSAGNLSEEEFLEADKIKPGQTMSQLKKISYLIEENPYLEEDFIRFWSDSNNQESLKNTLQEAKGSSTTLLNSLASGNLSSEELENLSKIKGGKRSSELEEAYNWLVENKVSFIDFWKNPENIQKLETTLKTSAENDNRLKAISSIAVGLKGFLRSTKWELFCQKSAADLKLSIQGELNPEALISKLEFKVEGRLSSERAKSTQDFLEVWIKKSSHEDLRKFVKAISSNNTLGSKNLIIELYDRDESRIPNSHTCSNTLELPANYPTQEVFDNKLKLLINEEGFQVA